MRGCARAHKSGGGHTPPSPHAQAGHSCAPRRSHAPPPLMDDILRACERSSRARSRRAPVREAQREERQLRALRRKAQRGSSDTAVAAAGAGRASSVAGALPGSGSAADGSAALPGGGGAAGESGAAGGSGAADTCCLCGLTYEAAKGPPYAFDDVHDERALEACRDGVAHRVCKDMMCDGVTTTCAHCGRGGASVRCTARTGTCTSGAAWHYPCLWVAARHGVALLSEEHFEAYCTKDCASKCSSRMLSKGASALHCMQRPTIRGPLPLRPIYTWYNVLTNQHTHTRVCAHATSHAPTAVAIEHLQKPQP